MQISKIERLMMLKYEKVISFRAARGIEMMHERTIATRLERNGKLYLRQRTCAIKEDEH
jgi:hypothetical protein